ncbi:hypothetical protein MMC07_003469 [Pseudocyphellaria aurata]|nr:hypothetical protein [Pseudocyphellaria aurata]
MAALWNIIWDSRLILLSGASFLLYFVGLAFYRLYFHPLAKFPGPKIAAVSRYYEFYHDAWKNGRYIFKIAEMHQKYGRTRNDFDHAIFPYELHIHDVESIDKIYTQEGRWDKYAFPMVAFGSMDTTFMTLKHDAHRRRRAALNPFFSKQKVATLEPLVEEKIGQLSRRLQDFASSARVLSLSTAYSALTSDIVTAYTMIKGQDNLEAEDFNQSMVEAARGNVQMWHWGKYIPFIIWLYERTPVWMMRKFNVQMAEWTALGQKTFREAQGFFSLESSDPIYEKAHKTIFYEIATSESLLPEDKSLARIHADTMSVNAAGTETTAHALRVITFHLCENPGMVQKLRAELKSVDLSSPNTRKLPQLEKLPYLYAVINEGLRLSFGVVSRLARIAPNRVIQYGEWKIPPRTPVGMSAGLIHLDPNAFSRPHAFDPERWMDPAERKRLEKYMVPFSKGTRSCLGINLAWAEFYLTIAILFSKFDFSLRGTTVDDVAFHNDFFVPGQKSANGVRVTVNAV